MSLETNGTLLYDPSYVRQYNGQKLYVACEVFIVLEAVCVALRFYSRKLGNVPWGVDDVLIVPSAVFCLSMCACGLCE